MSKKNNKIAVFGGGLWGTVLAQHLSRGADRPVWLWEYFAEAANALAASRRHPHIPDFRLADGVRVTSTLAEAVEDAEVLLFVLPSQFIRRAAAGVRGLRPRRDAAVVNASKGIEPGTLLTLGGVLGQELPGHRSRLFALSGPSFAREVARGKETAMVLAGPSLGRAALRRALEGPAVRIEESSDRVGVELGGSLKNVLAIGCGVLDGLGCGANTKAAFVSRGLAEMAALAARAGGRRETVYGLSGLGDLVATGTSPESRNRAFGEKLGRGKTMTQALGEIPTVIEGIEAAAGARALARKLRIRTPLMDGVWRIVHGNAGPRALLAGLGFGAG